MANEKQVCTVGSKPMYCLELNDIVSELNNWLLGREELVEIKHAPECISMIVVPHCGKTSFAYMS